MTDLNKKEHIRNMAAWQNLAIRSLGETGPLPVAFVCVPTAAQAFEVLATRPQVALCIFPVHISPAAQNYANSLELADYSPVAFLRDAVAAEPAFLKGANGHYRSKVIHAVAPSQMASATSLFEALAPQLPDKPGRNAFVRDYAALVQPLVAQFAGHQGIGDFKTARLMAAHPWVPAPEIMRPHIDLNANTRMHLVFKGNQTVVVAGALAPDYPQLADCDSDDSFPRLAQLPPACLLSVPAGYGAVWRGDENGKASGVILPHLEQYNASGLRFTSRVCFSHKPD